MKTSDKINNTVWATLRPSNIHGIGVFAIRDIPKGTIISTNTIENPGDFVYDITEEDFNEIIPEIQELILDRMLYRKEQFSFVINPNAEAILQSFMNHSDEPNTNGRMTLRDIKKGEELTETYRSYLDNGHVFTREHLKKFIC